MFRNYAVTTIRHLFRQRFYSAINISSLAIGIACSILIFLHIQNEFSYDTYHSKADHIFRLADHDDARISPAIAPAIQGAFPDVVDYVRLQQPYNSWQMSYGDKAFGERKVYWADAQIFSIFSFPFEIGNPKTALQAPYSIVISQSMAKKYFGNENPFGKTIQANGTDWQVTGVIKDMPPNSHFNADFFVSLSTQSKKREDKNEISLNEDYWPRLYHTYLLLVQKSPANTLEQNLSSFVNQHRDQITKDKAITFDLQLQPLTTIHLHSHLKNELGTNGDIIYVYVLLTLALFIAVLAAINFMNLATIRSTKRSQEVGLRKVVGAQQSQLIQQFLGESTLLVAISLLLALIIVELFLPWFNLWTGTELTLNYAGDPFVWLKLIGFAILLSILAGGYPALFLSSFQPIKTLKGHTKVGSVHTILRRSLVVFQFLVSTVLIIGIGIVYTQMAFLRNHNLGFDKDHIVVFQTRGSTQKYRLFKNELLKHAEVLGVTRSSTVPSRSDEIGAYTPRSVFPENGTMQEFQLFKADFDFVKTYGMEIISGQDFSQDFAHDPKDAVIINETAAKLLGWPSPEDAVGKQIHRGGGYRIPIIGVVKDFNIESLRQKVIPIIIEAGRGKYISVRMQPDRMMNTMNTIQNVWVKTFPNMPLTFNFMDEDIDKQYVFETQFTKILILFASVTILIACLGLFGLSAFAAEQRTKEIGIRKVLGASISNIAYLISKEFLQLIVLANIVAWPIVYYIAEIWLQDFAYRTNIEVSNFLIGGGAVFTIVILTVGYQGIKAATINPVEAIRHE